MLARRKPPSNKTSFFIKDILDLPATHHKLVGNIDMNFLHMPMPVDPFTHYSKELLLLREGECLLLVV